jgi:hypothetical protein
MVSANRVIANGWMEGIMVVSIAGQILCVIEGVITGVTEKHRKTLT